MAKNIYRHFTRFNMYQQRPLCDPYLCQPEMRDIPAKGKCPKCGSRNVGCYHLRNVIASQHKFRCSESRDEAPSASLHLFFSGRYVPLVTTTSAQCPRASLRSNAYSAFASNALVTVMPDTWNLFPIRMEGLAPREYTVRFRARRREKQMIVADSNRG